MDRRRREVVLRRGASVPYSQRITSLLGSSLIAYYPLDETSGTTAYDRSGNGRNGTHVLPTLANAVSPNGKPAPLFSTAGGFVQLNIGGNLNAAFNSQEGCTGGFVKVPANYWTDNTFTVIANLFKDGGNKVYIYHTIDDYVLYMTYYANSVVESVSMSLNPYNWFHWMISWSLSNDRVIVWINGVPQITQGATLGTWTHTTLSATKTNIGADTAPTPLFNGWQSDFFIANREPTKSEAITLATAQVRPKRISVVGDSISGLATPTVPKWYTSLQHTINNGWGGVITHGAGGATIISSMDAQVVAAASDEVETIIIFLGVNDDNAGNMATLQAEAEENIIELQTGHPSAQIVWVNVLPCWTNSTGAVEVDKGNIRTAIAAACTAQGISCIDTYSTPWITAAQTSDGTHPTLAGHAAIATQLAARL